MTNNILLTRQSDAALSLLAVLFLMRAKGNDMGLGLGRIKKGAGDRLSQDPAIRQTPEEPDAGLTYGPSRRSSVHMNNWVIEFLNRPGRPVYICMLFHCNLFC